VAEQGALKSAVTAYDNFEQVDSVKAQRVEDNSVFHSVTTGELIQGADIPPGGLRQDMLNSKVRLGLEDVLLASGNKDDEIECEVSSSVFIS